jgi:hypothetical protein
MLWFAPILRGQDCHFSPQLCTDNPATYASLEKKFHPNKFSHVPPTSHLWLFPRKTTFGRSFQRFDKRLQQRDIDCSRQREICCSRVFPRAIHSSGRIAYPSFFVDNTHCQILLFKRKRTAVEHCLCYDGSASSSPKNTPYLELPDP